MTLVRRWQDGPHAWCLTDVGYNLINSLPTERIIWKWEELLSLDFLRNPLFIIENFNFIFYFAIVGAFVTWRTVYAPHTSGALCNRRCALACIMHTRAWVAPVRGVRGARCVPLLVVRVATITTRTTHSCAPYIGALPHTVPARAFLSRSLHGTLPVFASASSLPLASVSASAFALPLPLLLLCSRHSSLHRLCLPLVATDFNSHYSHRRRYVGAGGLKCTKIVTYTPYRTACKWCNL